MSSILKGIGKGTDKNLQGDTSDFYKSNGSNNSAASLVKQVKVARDYIGKDSEPKKEPEETNESYWGGPSPAQLRFNRALKKQQNSPENKADREKFQQELDRIMPPPKKPEDDTEKQVTEKTSPEIFNRPKNAPIFSTKPEKIGNYIFDASEFEGSMVYGKDAKGLVVKAYDPKTMDVIGSASFVLVRKKGKNGDSWLESDETKVQEKYRGKGIATAMYQYAKNLGNDIKPSPYKSSAGGEMWKAWGRDVFEDGSSPLSGKTDSGYTWKFEAGREVPWKSDVAANTFVRVTDPAGKTVAGVWADVAGDSLEVEYSQVFDEELRGRGLYTDLLKSLSDHYDITSDTDANNAAVNVYKRLGADHDTRQARHTLRKKGVAEGGAETSWSTDTEKITLQDILELTDHIKQINLPINDNLKSKLIHWDGNPEEIERINQVIVSNQFPILVMLDEQGQIQFILDGNHRLHKAIKAQAKTIPAKLIKPGDLNDKAKRILHINEQAVAEGSAQITELRDRMYQYIKSIVPIWPDYVVQDWLYKGKGKNKNFNADGGNIKDEILKMIAGAGLSPNVNPWQLVPNMKFTMDMFDPITKQRLIGRAGGKSDLGMGIPKDKERHATQAQLAQQQGGVRKEPVLLIKTSEGYELLEGWHRTIQHFAKYPEGYTGPAYVAVAQGQQGVAEGRKKKKKKTSRSLGRYFFPGYGYYASGESGEGGGDGGGGESMAEGTNVDIGGIKLNVAVDGAEVIIRPIVDEYQAGYAVFDRDGNTLVPADLAIDEEFRGQGIAKIIYDYVKSLGFNILRSNDQTRAGKHFWDKNRGEGSQVWEHDMLDEACWKGYHKEGNKKMFGKTYPNCVKNTNEGYQQCPECGGPMFSEEMINEKKDACYYKVKSRYKVWPSAYASGALVQCRKKGANNWGTKSESSILEGIEQTDEDLHKWFKEKWVRFGPDGKIRGACARGDGSEGKPKCLPQSKAQNLGKKGRASAASRKRREDPNPERSGKAINVATKKKTTESSILQGISETKGLPMPGSYEQEYGPFKKKGGYRIMTLTSEQEELDEKWSNKYKRSIDCNHPKGFSQKAHCQGKKKK